MAKKVNKLPKKTLNWYRKMFKKSFKILIESSSPPPSKKENV